MLNPFNHRNPEQQSLMEEPISHAQNLKSACKDADRQQRERELMLRRIENDFTYHAPKSQEQIERYELIRDTARRLARVMVENCPPSRELATALTTLETATFHANAAIARNE